MVYSVGGPFSIQKRPSPLDLYDHRHCRYYYDCNIQPALLCIATSKHVKLFDATYSRDAAITMTTILFGCDLYFRSNRTMAFEEKFMTRRKNWICGICQRIYSHQYDYEHLLKNRREEKNKQTKIFFKNNKRQLYAVECCFFNNKKRSRSNCCCHLLYFSL